MSKVSPRWRHLSTPSASSSLADTRSHDDRGSPRSCSGRVTSETTKYVDYLSSPQEGALDGYSSREPFPPPTQPSQSRGGLGSLSLSSPKTHAVGSSPGPEQARFGRLSARSRNSEDNFLLAGTQWSQFTPRVSPLRVRSGSASAPHELATPSLCSPVVPHHIGPPVPALSILCRKTSGTSAAAGASPALSPREALNVGIGVNRNGSWSSSGGGAASGQYGGGGQRSARSLSERESRMSSSFFQHGSPVSNNGSVSRLGGPRTPRYSDQGGASSRALSFQRGRAVGSGGFGTVFQAVLSDGTLAAVKELKFERDNVKAIDREVRAMSNLPPHPNCVRYFGSRHSTHHYYIIMEYISGGSIHALRQSIGPFRESVFQQYAYMTLQGLSHLHTHGIVHRDIKGANVLLDERGCAKIVDFGCCKDLNQATTTVGGGGTPLWMSPEVCRGGDANEKSDVWSFGCLCLEMTNATGLPWNFPPDMNLQGVAYALACAQNPPEIPRNLSALARDFIADCLRIDPEERLSIAELLEHQFFDQDYLSESENEDDMLVSREPSMRESAVKRMAKVSFLATNEQDPDTPRHYQQRDFDDHTADTEVSEPSARTAARKTGDSHASLSKSPSGPTLHHYTLCINSVNAGFYLDPVVDCDNDDDEDPSNIDDILTFAREDGGVRPSLTEVESSSSFDTSDTSEDTTSASSSCSSSDEDSSSSFASRASSRCGSALIGTSPILGLTARPAHKLRVTHDGEHSRNSPLYSESNAVTLEDPTTAVATNEEVTPRDVAATAHRCSTGSGGNSKRLTPQRGNHTRHLSFQDPSRCSTPSMSAVAEDATSGVDKQRSVSRPAFSRPQAPLPKRTFSYDAAASVSSISSATMPAQRPDSTVGSAARPAPLLPVTPRTGPIVSGNTIISNASQVTKTGSTDAVKDHDQAERRREDIVWVTEGYGSVSTEFSSALREVQELLEWKTTTLSSSSGFHQPSSSSFSSASPLQAHPEKRRRSFVSKLFRK